MTKSSGEQSTRSKDEQKPFANLNAGAEHDNTFTRDLLILLYALSWHLNMLNCEIWTIAWDFLNLFAMQRLVLV